MNVKLIRAHHLLLVCVLALLPLVTHGNTLERIRASQAITLGYVPDFMPFSDQAADKASGYAIDLCLKIAETCALKFLSGSTPVESSSIHKSCETLYIQEVSMTDRKASCRERV